MKLGCPAPPPHEAETREADTEQGERAGFGHGREIEEADRSDIVES